MNASVIELYEQLVNAPDERTRARLIAEAISEVDSHYPRLKEVATRHELKETELRLTREIGQIRLEIEQVRADLSKEIEQVRADLSKEIEQVRADLSKEIEQVRAEVKIGLAQVQSNLLKWSFLFWSAQMTALVVLLVKLL